ncbi:hypothetical protein L204_101265 [Cryptococcus depauperatus]|nr:hypothetical protein L204_03935 [Cryptococcus depauperatus CBS 7855]
MIPATLPTQKPPPLQSRQDCPSPPIKNRRYPLPIPSSPLRNSHFIPDQLDFIGARPIPPTPAISTFSLPPPIGFLTPRRSPPAASLIKFPPAPPPTRNYTAGATSVGEGSLIPNSLKDLYQVRSMGSSTVKPIGIRRPARAGVDKGLMSGSLGFANRMKEIESELFKYAQDASSVWSETSQNDDKTIKGLETKMRKVAIDEVDVEWCFRCGKEGERGEMELKEEEGKGLQWTCGECKKKLE